MRLHKILVGLILLTVPLNCAAQAVADEPKRREGEIWFEPTKMEVGGQAFEGERGHLIVKENRQKPNFNLIELVFVRFKSTSDKPGYPTVYLDGGPGSSAIGIANIPDYMRAFQKLREVGDVILLDQRGVGRSKPNLTHRATESTFKSSTHIVIDNAGHESMLVDPQVQQTMVQFLRGEDVSKVKIALPALQFQSLP